MVFGKNVLGKTIISNLHYIGCGIIQIELLRIRYNADCPPLFMPERDRSAAAESQYEKLAVVTLE
jgi:hypothetical protein